MRVSEIRVKRIRVNQGLGVIEREIEREKVQMKPPILNLHVNLITEILFSGMNL